MCVQMPRMEGRQPGPYVGYPTLDDLREIVADYPEQLTVDLVALAAEQARVASARPSEPLPARSPLPTDKTRGSTLWTIRTCLNQISMKFTMK